MNFFAAQEQARKSTRWLVLWFILGVLGVIVTIYAVTTTVLNIGMSRANGQQATQALEPGQWWNPMLFLWIALIAGCTILIGSLSKLSQLSAGGQVVARDLGGRQVDPSTRDFKERQLLNVVEEMAIASGTPVPDVWIMDAEPSINAFAAGTDPANAVIGVTRGTLDQLSRSELQGVVAHEFSHILNGDMKLNMRLTGWIFGLVMLSIIGRMMLESVRFMRGGRDSKGNGIIIVIAVLGLTVWLSGMLGSLFARLMQAAISRQREFLADASAVQFTRDSSGIAGALKKIGGLARGNELHAAKAAEARHMFFSPSSLTSLFATHPPLIERIRAIEPQWDGKTLDGSHDHGSDIDNSGRAAGFASASVSPPPLLKQLGHSGNINAAAGAAMIASLPANTSSDQTTKDDAKAMLLGLLVSPEAESLASDTLIGRDHPTSEIDAAIQWSRQLRGTTSAQKLALIDRSLPWLRRMSPGEAEALITSCQMLVEADGRIDLFEFMMMQVIRRHISIGLGLEQPPAMRHLRITDLEPQVAGLVALFGALVSDADATVAAREEYHKHTGRVLPAADASLAMLADALHQMDASTPLVKNQILRLCSLVITHDDRVDDEEIQLLRATADAIGASMPPLLMAA